MDAASAQRSNDWNKVAHILSMGSAKSEAIMLYLAILAAIFLPLNLVTVKPQVVPKANNQECIWYEYPRASISSSSVDCPSRGDCIKFNRASTFIASMEEIKDN